MGNQLRLLLLLLAFSPAAFAQFGGGPGDVVLYALTAKGSGEFQVVSPTTPNAPQSAARFRVVGLDNVPVLPADPFPIRRQVLYEEDDELFQVGTDLETTVGLHRIFIVRTKIFLFQGLNNPLGALLGNVTNYISFPKDLDLVGDVALETLKVLTWAPRRWPFIVLTDRRGPLGPPDISGFEYLFQLPGLVRLPSLLPWTNMRRIYPGAGWPDGADLKLLETDPEAGSTTRLLRLRPGRRTPLFRTAGHTHLFVLQGQLEITPAGAGTVPMVRNDYAFLPPGFVISLVNPKQYDGPGVR